MRWWWSAVLAVGLCCTPGYGQGLDVEKERDIRTLIELLGLPRRLASMPAALESIYAEAVREVAAKKGAAPEPILKAIRAKLESKYAKVMLEGLLPIFDKHFTREELKTVIDTWGSETSNRIVNQGVPRILEEAGPAVQQQVGQMMLEILEELSDEFPELAEPRPSDASGQLDSHECSESTQSNGDFGAVQFVLETRNRGTIYHTGVLQCGDVLDFTASGLKPGDTFHVVKCGDPCNSATILADLKGNEAEAGALTFTVRQAGRYYFWIQPSGQEPRGATIESFNATERGFAATFNTGSRITASLEKKDIPQSTTSSPPEASSDDVEIVNVLPSVDTPLKSDSSAQFAVTVRYSLHSIDRAVLSVYAERFQDSPEGCDGDTHQTEAGTDALVARGTGQVTLRFTWRESSGPNSEVSTGSAYLGIGVNLWSEANGTPVKPLLKTLPVSACHPVLP